MGTLYFQDCDEKLARIEELKKVGFNVDTLVTKRVT